MKLKEKKAGVRSSLANSVYHCLVKDDASICATTERCHRLRCSVADPCEGGKTFFFYFCCDAGKLSFTSRIVVLYGKVVSS